VPAQEERVSDRRLSPREAAEYIEREWHLRVHHDTVRRWTRGGLPAQRDERGRLLIDPDDLHSLLDCSVHSERKRSVTTDDVNANGSVD
jgi:hypothetical protein